MEGLWKRTHSCLRSLVDSANELARLLEDPIYAQQACQGMQLLRDLCSIAS